MRFGKPVIRGTRVDVATIVGHVAAGDSFDDIIENYAVTREDILLALRWATRLVEAKSARLKRAARKTQT